MGGASSCGSSCFGVDFGQPKLQPGGRFQNGVIKDRNDKLMAVEDLNKVVTIQHQLTKINEQHSGKNALIQGSLML